MITELVGRKAASAKQDLTARVAVLDDFIACAFIESESRFSAVHSQAKALVVSTVLGEAGTLNAIIPPVR